MQVQMMSNMMQQVDKGITGWSTNDGTSNPFPAFSGIYIVRG